MSFIRKLKNDAIILWHSLFYGLRAADSLIHEQTSGEDGVEINKQVKPSGPYADMLENKMTKEVEEVRDKMYRVYREANKFDRGTLSLEEETIINEEGKEETILTFTGNVKKKTKVDFMKHPPVYEKDGYILRVIQDVKHMSKSSSFAPDFDSLSTSLYDYDTNLTIERDFIPRFEIEKFAKKIVVMTRGTSDRDEIHLYLPSEASQFGKIDAILIANLHRMLREKNYRADITDFKTISFYTDHAWNCEDMCEFKYDDIKLIDIVMYDGSFVLVFDAHIVYDGIDLVKKYRTKELDEKYKYQSPKIDGVGIEAAARRAKKDENNEIDFGNIGDTTINLS